MLKCPSSPLQHINTWIFSLNRMISQYYATILLITIIHPVIIQPLQCKHLPLLIKTNSFFFSICDSRRLCNWTGLFCLHKHKFKIWHFLYTVLLKNVSYNSHMKFKNLKIYLIKDVFYSEIIFWFWGTDLKWWSKSRKSRGRKLDSQTFGDSYR